MKLIKWIAAFLLGTLALLVGGALTSSWYSLDRELTHTRETSELKTFTEQASGIVRIPAGDYEFRARVAGLDNAEAETVILLHGFPVTSAMWIPLIKPLEDAGYRVVAFDQRGYSPGARPDDQSAYIVPNLVADVITVADAVGADEFHLVGHDWGSAVGWSTVMSRPDRILSWTGLSIAHPVAFTEALENDPDQQARSRYFALFTAPVLPETLFTLNDLGILMSFYAGMREDQQSEYYRVFSEPGALTATLNWYRMMASGIGVEQPSPEISVPTLFIWGNDDPSAGRASVEGQRKYLTGHYEEIELDGDHWLVTSHGDEIAQALVSHLGRVPAQN